MGSFEHISSNDSDDVLDQFGVLFVVNQFGVDLKNLLFEDVFVFLKVQILIFLVEFPILSLS